MGRFSRPPGGLEFISRGVEPHCTHSECSSDPSSLFILGVWGGKCPLRLCVPSEVVAMARRPVQVRDTLTGSNGFSMV
eukprot:309347-Pyramimonas_sp.AAC.1